MLQAVLRVDEADGGFDKAKDMCDHFTCNPNNPGWTSTGVGGIYLKKIQEHFHGAIGPGTLDRIYRIIRISPVPKENQVAFDEATKTKAYSGDADARSRSQRQARPAGPQ